MLRILLVNDTEKPIGELRDALLAAGYEVLEEVAAAGALLKDPVVFPPAATVKKLETNQVSAAGKRLRERIWTEFKAS